MDYCRMFYEPMLRPLASNTYDHSRPLCCPLISFILQLQHELYVISSLILYFPPDLVCTLSNVGGFPSWCKGFTASWHDRATVFWQGRNPNHIFPCPDCVFRLLVTDKTGSFTERQHPTACGCLLPFCASPPPDFCPGHPNTPHPPCPPIPPSTFDLSH